MTDINTATSMAMDEGEVIDATFVIRDEADKNAPVVDPTAETTEEPVKTTAAAPLVEKLHDKKESEPEMSRSEAMQLVSNDPTLANVQKYLPSECAELVISIMKTINYKDPMSIADVTAWAVSDLAEESLKLLEHLQEEPSREIMIEIDAFERELRDRVAPIQSRLDGNDMKLLDQAKSLATRVSRRAGGLIARWEDPKDREKRLAQEDLLKEQNEMKAIVNETIEDLERVNKSLSLGLEKPKVFEEKVETFMGKQREVAMNILMAVVALNEYELHLDKDVLPTTTDDQQINTIVSAKSRLIAAQADMMQAFLRTVTQGATADTMLAVNSDSLTKMRSLQANSIPGMLGSLSMVCIQHVIVAGITTVEQASRADQQAGAAVVEGLKKVETKLMKANETRRQGQVAAIDQMRETMAHIQGISDEEQRQYLSEKNALVALKAATNEVRAATLKIKSGKGSSTPQLTDGNGPKRFGRVSKLLGPKQ